MNQSSNSVKIQCDTKVTPPTNKSTYCVLLLCTISLCIIIIYNFSRKGVKYFSRIQNLLWIYVIATTLEEPCHFTIRINNPILQRKGRISLLVKIRPPKCAFFVIMRFAVNCSVISTICESCLGWLEITWTRSRSIMPGNFQLRRRRSSVLEHFCYRPQISL